MTSSVSCIKPVDNSEMFAYNLCTPEIEIYHFKADISAAAKSLPSRDTLAIDPGDVSSNADYIMGVALQ